MRISKSIKIFFISVLFFSCGNMSYDTSLYNTTITDTSNLIAYIYYEIKGMGPVRNQEIYLVNSQTGEQFRLTNDQFKDSDLCWSPDGNKILFVSHRSSNPMARQHDNYNFGSLYIYNFLTGEEISLENNISEQIDSLANLFRQDGHKVSVNEFYLPNSGYPTWINDGRIGFKRKIYFGKSYGYGELITIDITGKKLEFKRKPFSKRKVSVSNPQWINEDSIIVATSPLADFNFQLALYSSSENLYYSMKNIENHTGFGIFLSDNNDYLFINEAENLFQYNIRTGSKQLLNQNMKDIDSFIISPQNNKIAYVNRVEGNQNIFLMNLDGSNVKQLTFDGGFKHSIAWSPKNAF